MDQKKRKKKREFDEDADEGQNALESELGLFTFLSSFPSPFLYPSFPSHFLIFSILKKTVSFDDLMDGIGRDSTASSATAVDELKKRLEESKKKGRGKGSIANAPLPVPLARQTKQRVSREVPILLFLPLLLFFFLLTFFLGRFQTS